MPECTALDPLLYDNLELNDLKSELQNFLQSEDHVFVLLGQAGSGKSLFLQKCFVENVIN